MSGMGEIAQDAEMLLPWLGDPERQGGQEARISVRRTELTGARRALLWPESVLGGGLESLSN